MSKILLIHNIIAPYRIPLFDKISEIHELKVLFIEKIDEKRLWNQNADSLNFDYSYLNTDYIKIFGRKFFFLNSNKINYNYDYIIVPDEPKYFQISYMLIKSCRKINPNSKIILWTPNFKFYSPFNNFILDSLLIFLLNNFRKFFLYNSVDAFWTYGKYSSKYIHSKFNIDNSKIYSGLQGMSKKLINFDKKIDIEKRFNENKILFLGYISKRKGLNLLVNAFLALCNEKKYSNLSLHIIGNQNSTLKKILNNSNNIFYEGYLEGYEKFKLMNKCKLLVVPSYYDPWAWVTNEAMSIGIPVVLSESVMSKEMVTNKNHIFKNKSIDSLKNSLTHILNMDLKNYERLSKESEYSASKHTIDKTLKSFENILNAK